MKDISDRSKTCNGLAKRGLDTLGLQLCSREWSGVQSTTLGKRQEVKADR